MNLSQTKSQRSSFTASAGSAAANSAEIRGCWKTEGWGFKGLQKCWRATCKVACQSEKNFSPMWRHFYLFFKPPSFIFFGRTGLGYEAQAVFSGSFNFPQQHILGGEKEDGGEGNKQEQNRAWHRTSFHVQTIQPVIIWNNYYNTNNNWNNQTMEGLLVPTMTFM